MDPRYEQMLRNEVIYLHSLWHQGPPGNAAAVVPAAPPRHHLQPTQSTQFKKDHKPKAMKRTRKSKTKPDNSIPELNSSTGAKWPCPAPSPPTTGWPSLQKPDPTPPIALSPEEKLNSAAKLSQQSALKAIHSFFIENSYSDESDAIDSDSSDEDDGSSMEENDERDEYSFFLNLLTGDAELKEHYMNFFAKGVFSCLVCDAVGQKKMGKKYHDCLALVQHSITINKTKKRRAHRAFAQAVCKVLNWDIDQLPAVVSMLSEMQGNANFDDNVDSVEDNNGKVVPESGAVFFSQGTVDFDNKEISITSASNVDSGEGNSGEAAMESGAIVSFLPERKFSELQEDNFDNRESSISFVSNIDSLESNISVVPTETGAIDTKIASNGDDENTILARQIDMVYRSLQNKGALKGNHGIRDET